MRLDPRIEFEQLSFVYDKVLYKSLAGVVLGTAVLAWILRPVIDGRLLAVWIALNLINVVLAAASIRLFGLFASVKKRGLWVNLLIMRMLFSGLVFGGLVWFIPGEPELLVYHAFYYCVIAGMVAGATGTFSMIPPAFFAYGVSAFVPATLLTFLRGHEMYLAMGIMGSLFIVVITLTVRNLHHTLIRSLELRFRNEDLVGDLRSQKQKSELLNVKLQELALKDPLTGLRNRRFLFDVMEEEMYLFARFKKFQAGRPDKRSNSPSHVYGISLIDIDHFKQINDTYGHDAGDAFLRQFSALLLETVRADDSVIRWGGEEFLVILKKTLPDYMNEYAQKVVQRVREYEFRLPGGRIIRRTCSVGFTHFPLLTLQLDHLALDQSIVLADHALYRAKEQGRDQIWRTIPKDQTYLHREEIIKLIGDPRHPEFSRYFSIEPLR